MVLPNYNVIDEFTWNELYAQKILRNRVDKRQLKYQ